MNKGASIRKQSSGGVILRGAAGFGDAVVEIDGSYTGDLFDADGRRVGRAKVEIRPRTPAEIEEERQRRQMAKDCCG